MTDGAVPHVLVLSHSTGMAGPIDNLESYLRHRGAQLSKVQHPLDDYTILSTSVSGPDGSVRSYRRRSLGPVNYVIDLLFSLCLSISSEAEIIIGDTNLDAFAALIARRLSWRSRPKVVYFACDYSDERFAGGSPLNAMYSWVEQRCLVSADLVVSNTGRAERKRLARKLIPARSRVVPNGVFLAAPPQPRVFRDDAFCYVGSVTPEHGLLDVLDALRPRMSSLLLIGDGPEWDRVLAMCAGAGIKVESYRNVSRGEVLARLATFNGMGLAPYNRQESWTHYCSPMKVNEYLASGVPVLMSDVPEIAEYVASHRLGAVYSDVSESGITLALAKFEISGFIERATQFQQEFSAERLYDTLDLLGAGPPT